MPTSFYNKSQFKQTRRLLRKNQTEAEASLWKYLRNGNLKGRKFRRQFSIGNYILDFYCSHEKLGIELDGEVHYADQIYERDIQRTQWLKDNGIRIIRFENKEIYQSLEFVLKTITSYFKS